MQHRPPLLIVFSGLPGTGKTTISTMLAARLGAFHLRIDTIEQALRNAGIMEIGPAGYAIANELAAANLHLGHAIVADCVNPVRESRLSWQAIAEHAQARLIDIHVICSDPAEHRHRVEHRTADITGHILPTWDAVTAHEFEPHDGEVLLLDTANRSPTASVERCQRHIADARLS